MYAYIFECSLIYLLNYIVALICLLKYFSLETFLHANELIMC